MKTIDLLNKIANGEKLPYRIKYNERIYEYAEEIKWYLRDDMKCELFIDKNRLNDEVEILEEEKKIPEKSNIDFNTKLPVSDCSENEAFMMTCISHLGKTIDILIDYLKSKGE